MLPRGPTSPPRSPLTVLFSSQRSFDSTDHFCSPPFVCPARIDGLTRPQTCSQAFGTDIGNQRSRANGSVIGSSMSWAGTVKLSSRQQPERRHDEPMIMPHNTLRQLQPPSFLKKTIGPSVSGSQSATVFMRLAKSSFASIELVDDCHALIKQNSRRNTVATIPSFSEAMLRVTA